MENMKIQHTIYLLLGFLLSSCGEDRSGEYYALIEDKMWIEETMQKNYLWNKDMPIIEKESEYFTEPATFFKKLLSKVCHIEYSTLTRCWMQRFTVVYKFRLPKRTPSAAFRRLYRARENSPT